MAYENVLYEVKGKIATITLNRPESLNALSEPLMIDLESALREADKDENVSVIIIKGAGRAFCAGFNIAPSPARSKVMANITADRSRLHRNLERLSVIWSVGKPVIAQVHGYCITGGTIIALMSDITIVAEDARIHPLPVAGPLGAGLTSTLWAWQIGLKKAKEYCFCIGKALKGKEAAKIGWANRAVPAEKLDAEVRKVAEEIAMTPLEILNLEKVCLSRFQETMGLRAAYMFGAEIDALAHFTPPIQEFTNQIKEKGIKQASNDWKKGIRSSE